MDSGDVDAAGELAKRMLARFDNSFGRPRLERNDIRRRPAPFGHAPVHFNLLQFDEPGDLR
jgi:hypothetical protein